MSKFFITNKSEIAQVISQEIQLSEFDICFEKQSNSIYAFATKKLKINNQNSLSLQDDFVITNGMLLYKNGNSIENWKQLYNDYTFNIPNIRSQSCGNYAVCIKKGKVIDIWGEEFGGFNIYYYNDKNSYLISNSLYDLAKVLKNKLSINYLNIYEETLQNGILGEETFFNEIKRLSGNQYLHIKVDDEILTVNELPLLYPICKEDSMVCAEKVSKILSNRAQTIKKVIGNPSINMTGGLDARISLATYLSVGAKPFLNYGVGNTGLTNTKIEDLNIDMIFRDRYNLDLRIGSWITPNPIDKHWEYYISKYGFLSTVYAGSDDVMKFFENSQGNIITFGYAGELYRNLPWIENRKKNYFSIDEFIDEYYITGDVYEMSHNIPNYREHIKNKLLKICNRYHLDPNHIANVDNFYFLLEYRKVADTKLLNLCNMIKFSNLLLSEQECLKNIRVEISDMYSSKFMLTIINKLYPDALEVPVFSHCSTRKYVKSTGILSSEKKSIKSYIVPLFPHKFRAYIKKSIKGVEVKNKERIESFIKDLLNKLSDKSFSNEVITNLADYRKIFKYIHVTKIIQTIMSK